jgi:hypothetical protein
MLGNSEFRQLLAEQSMPQRQQVGQDFEVEPDPVAWVRQVGGKIETKTRGLVPFDPYPFQEQIMRAVVAGKAYVIPKSRQLGVSTAIMVAFAHQILHRHELTGVPHHCHIVANTETVAVQRLLKITKTILATAELPKWQRDNITGIDPKTNNEEIRYYTEGAQNYIRAHSSSPNVARSFDANAALIEEVAAMPYADEIWKSLASILADQVNLPLFIVSTYAGDGDLFCELVDNAKDFGLKSMPLDWRAHPHRDAAWKRRSIRLFAGREEEWEEEHELKRIRSGQRVVDIGLVEKWAKETKYLGPDPIVGHKYSKGVDIAGSGRDKTVHIVIDLTANPAQVVYWASYNQQDTKAAIWAIEELDRRFPGPLFIDGTMDPAIASLTTANNKTAVRFTGGSEVNEKIDRTQGLKWMNVPRQVILSWCAADLERGRLVVHPEKFPELFLGLKTAQSGTGKKRKGKNVDDLDAALLADLALTHRRVRPTITDEAAQAMRVPSDKHLKDLMEQRW